MPAPGAAGAGGSGLSATSASVVSTMELTDAAFSSAERVTLVGVDDTGGDHVAVDFLVSVEAVADLAAGLDLLKNDAAVDTGVGRDLTDRAPAGALDDDLDAGLLIALDLG